MASKLSFFFLIIVTEFLILTASEKIINNNQISLGSSLSPNTKNNWYWLSNSGQFAFGFYQQDNGFGIGIWFNEKINRKTVVWTANQVDLLPLSNDVTLLLNGDGRLVLQGKQGLAIPIAKFSQPAVSASMLDSGNFVLYNSNSTIIWQSFDSPTDTLLPGQRLVTGRKLVSAKESSMRFQLVMQGDGNLVQYPVDIPKLQDNYAYWATNTIKKGGKLSLNLDPNGHLYMLNSIGFKIKTIFPGRNHQSHDGVLYRLTIDLDGILRLYSVGINKSWVPEWASVENKCAPTELCGLNSYCVVKDGEQDSQEPSCSCLPGFDFVDQRQRKLGCQRNSSVDCTLQNQNHEDDKFISFVELDGITWNDDADTVVLSKNKTACREECLRDCNCQVAQFQGPQCKKLSSPLRFGKFERKEFIGTTIIKVRTSKTIINDDDDDDSHQQEVRIGIFIGSIVISSLGLIGLAITGALIYRFRVGNHNLANQGNDKLLEDVTLRPYTFSELEAATNGFSDEVGKGAFGIVFKGIISSNSLRTNQVVAVKRLERVFSNDSVREFRNEMRVIGKTHHRTLVKLLGYCHEGLNRLLVYEYMENGSLAGFLFRLETKPTWEERTRIALDIARGILYLHEECETQIIHCNIKAENILLNDQNSAKIADFGLAKLLMPDQTRTSTHLRGTRGYVGPEWHRINMPITAKADVYSFGIVLLEIVCCRRSVQIDVPEDKMVLANWVYDCFGFGQWENLVQENHKDDESDIVKMIKLGLWCIQEEPGLRPSMKNVCLMLEGVLEIPPPPNPTSSVSIQID